MPALLVLGSLAFTQGAGAAPVRKAAASESTAFAIVLRAADPDWSKMGAAQEKAAQEKAIQEKAAESKRSRDLCELGLSPEGAALARQVGRALQMQARALEITTDGDCLSRETAQVLGLPARVAPEIAPGRRSGLAGRLKGLRDLISRPAAKTAPQVLIVNDDLIFGAFGTQVQEGEGFLLRPAAGGGYEIVKRLNQRWWENVSAALEAAPLAKKLEAAAIPVLKRREGRWASQPSSPGS